MPKPSNRLARWLAVLALHAPLLALPALAATVVQTPAAPPAPANSAIPADAPLVAPAPAKVQMLHAAGTKWVGADGNPVTLKGVNLGNWLINEFWMMGQGSNGIDDECKLEGTLDSRFGRDERERLMRVFRDNWITPRDWDTIASYGLNVVRLPFIYSVIEDEAHPGHLRADAWRYLDAAVAAAEQRGIYVILDLHGAAGTQGWEHHSGCAGKNLYWSTPAFQQRTIWLWQQVAARYRSRAAVAGYSMLNEPWGATPENLAVVMKTLYKAIRAVDQNHVIILPGHNKGGIDGYGKPSEQGMQNVAFEIHPYPGMFGWATPTAAVHRDWLRCNPDGGAGDTVCAWDARMRALDAPLLIGEFQPWAALGPALAPTVTRASYDTYARYGWAATAWAYKLVSQKGGQGEGTWGLVTNAPASPVPGLDFTRASKADIEALFKAFGSVQYEAQPGVQRALLEPKAAPFP
jgi:endoglucanase